MSLFSGEDSVQSCVHVAFFQSTMAPDVVFNADQGTDKRFQYWNLLSRSFKDMEIELKCFTQENEDSLIATSVTSVTLSEQTLLAVLPHLFNGDREDSQGIEKALLDQRITMYGSTHFEWDAMNGQVTTESDMLSPMLRLLGSLEHVSRVFAGGLVSLDFQWRRRQPVIYNSS
ncbi:hypothetical protein JG688_00010805 [Phytophthora aleatoria]|uniref:Uncharacterized protein n=1 Tax=Phytophthora aleatoria TaxID=2496075 RepID=A0A8J5MEY9_9STRA|nr:hypothetical protein JG688_00010805 [Phytophthora aleatoria]